MVFVAIDFNNKVLVTNPTSYFLGSSVLVVGIMAIATGAITYFTGDIIMPASAWIALGAPLALIGWIIMRSGVRKN